MVTWLASLLLQSLLTSFVPLPPPLLPSNPPGGKQSVCVTGETGAGETANSSFMCVFVYTQESFNRERLQWGSEKTAELARFLPI